MALPAPVTDLVCEISNAQQINIELKSLLHRGYFNVIYELRAGDDKRWCLRVSVDEAAALTAFRGSKILKALKGKHTAYRISAVILSTERYTVLEFLEGQPFGIWNKSQLEDERRQILLDHLADFLYGLWEDIHNPEALGQSYYKGWKKSFVNVDVGLRRTLLGTSAWGNPIHFLQLRERIDSLLAVFDDRLVAIKHGDLYAWNVIITDSDLSGVIDWDTSQVVAAASAIQYPLFIADIPGWNNDGVSEGMTFEDDRAYLVHAVRKLEGGPGRIATLLENSRERQFFEMSLRNQRIHHAYAVERLPGNFQKDSVLNELEGFLTLHSSMRNLASVLKVRAELEGDKEI